MNTRRALFLFLLSSALCACSICMQGAQSNDSKLDQWIPFDPPADSFEESPLDLRRLNEPVAGEGGFIQAKDGRFVHGDTGEPVRFWAVNGPPHEQDPGEMRRTARLLAKRGVNLARAHGRVFDRRGEADLDRVRHNLEVVEAMKAEGVYTHLSIYFPLWFTPPEDLDWLQGYDGKTHPFAALMFNEAFQEKYRQWWKALLTTPNPRTGKTLVEEPAVFGVEIQNEDSFFFWTFDASRIPEPQLRILEAQFGKWLKERYGSLESALREWEGLKLERDRPEEGRMGFRPLYNLFNEKQKRDRDTARFLYETQTAFYRETYDYLRSLGFKGLIHASNWHTASQEVLGPVEKLSYSVCDFIDRHGYFSCAHQGENAAWSIRDGHTFAHRSALRFDPEKAGAPKHYAHPVMDPEYAGKPSMISETTFTRPNRFRSEAPLFYAAYGALQDTDAIVHFALDGSDWSVKPNYWMQQWTLMSPSMMGQFPATALIYRNGWIAKGGNLAAINLNPGDVLALKGTPLPQGAAFDELRAKDIPAGRTEDLAGRVDPLIHLAGRTAVTFEDKPSEAKVADLSSWIRREEQTVLSSTGELKLDYGRGLLIVDAERAQGASGNLRSGDTIQTASLEIQSPMDLGHVLLVSLDERPLESSRRMLLQVMSEEKPTGFSVEPISGQRLRIENIGRNPWLFKALEGTVRIQREDAETLEVTALDHNGYPAKSIGNGREIQLEKDVLYYWIRKRDP